MLKNPFVWYILFLDLSYCFTPIKKYAPHSFYSVNGVRNHQPIKAIATENLKSSPIIQWYPGHIAKGEKALMSCLKRVDVVVEVRDARISTSTAHPLVDQWVGKAQPRLIVFAHLDQVPQEALLDWRKYLSYKVRGKIPMYWVDSKKGKGIHEVRRAILAKGDYVNQRRIRRGIKPRAIRAAVIGYPNVGKSAIINQLLGRHRAKSENRPGVTKRVEWARIGGGLQDIELLDSPGVIPSKQIDQHVAVKLAMCNEIGEVSYDSERVVPVLIELLRKIYFLKPSYVREPIQQMKKRYGIDVLSVSRWSQLDKLQLPSPTFDFYALSEQEEVEAELKRKRMNALTLNAQTSNRLNDRLEEIVEIIHETIDKDGKSSLASSSSFPPSPHSLRVSKEEDIVARKVNMILKENYPVMTVKTKTSEKISNSYKAEKKQEYISGDEYLSEMGSKLFKGDTGAAARKLLQELQSGTLGKFTLDIPPRITFQETDSENLLRERVPHFPSYGDDADAMLVASEKQANNLWGSYLLPTTNAGLKQLPTTKKSERLKYQPTSVRKRLDTSSTLLSRVLCSNLSSSTSLQAVPSSLVYEDKAVHKLQGDHLEQPTTVPRNKNTSSSKKLGFEDVDQTENDLPSQDQLELFSFEGW